MYYIYHACHVSSGCLWVTTYKGRLSSTSDQQGLIYMWHRENSTVLYKKEVSKLKILIITIINNYYHSNINYFIPIKPFKLWLIFTLINPDNQSWLISKFKNTEVNGEKTMLVFRRINMEITTVFFKWICKFSAT